MKGILWIQGFKNKLIVKKKVASKKLKKLKHSFRKNTTHHNITFQMCICFRIYLFYLFKITTRQTCSEKLCDKNIHFFGFTPYTHVCFLIPSWIFVPCVEILLIRNIFLVCIFKYRSRLHKYFWYFFISGVRNLVVLYIVTQSIT